MTAQNDIDRALGAWFAGEATGAPPPHPLLRMIESTRSVRPRPALVASIGSRWVGAGPTNGPLGGLAGLRPAMVVVIVALLLAALVGAAVLVGSRRVPMETVRGEFIPGPTLVETTGEGWQGIGLPDGRALIVGCPAVLVDPLTEAPMDIGSPLSCHHGGAIARLHDGRILIAGGGSEDDAAVAEIFDPATNTFTETGALVEGLSQAPATTLHDGRVLITGGILYDEGGGFAIPRAELYDPGTGTFTFTGPMLRPRFGHTATLLPDGRVLVTGGDGGTGPYADAEVWDPATGAFSATGDMTTGRQGATATLMGDGRVLVAGGYGGVDATGGVVLLATADIFDPSTDTFRATTPMRVARWLHVAAPLPDGRVLIAGGTSEPGGSGAAWTGNGIADAEIFDPRTGQFTVTMPMTHPRLHAIAVPLSDGGVLVAGHWDGAVQSTSDNPASPTTEVFR